MCKATRTEKDELRVVVVDATWVFGHSRSFHSKEDSEEDEMWMSCHSLISMDSECFSKESVTSPSRDKKKKKKKGSRNKTESSESGMSKKKSKKKKSKKKDEESSKERKSSRSRSSNKLLSPETCFSEFKLMLDSPSLTIRKHLVAPSSADRRMSKPVSLKAKRKKMERRSSIEESLNAAFENCDF